MSSFILARLSVAVAFEILSFHRLARKVGMGATPQMLFSGKRVYLWELHALCMFKPCVHRLGAAPRVGGGVEPSPPLICMYELCVRSL